MKYTVKNCQSIIRVVHNKMNAPIYWCNSLNPKAVDYLGLEGPKCVRCSDVSNCLIKRVIEKCRENTWELEVFGTGSLTTEFAQEILDMFEIENAK